MQPLLSGWGVLNLPRTRSQNHQLVPAASEPQGFVAFVSKSAVHLFPRKSVWEQPNDDVSSHSLHGDSGEVCGSDCNVVVGSEVSMAALDVLVFVVEVVDVAVIVVVAVGVIFVVVVFNVVVAVIVVVVVVTVVIVVVVVVVMLVKVVVVVVVLMVVVVVAVVVVVVVVIVVKVVVVVVVVKVVVVVVVVVVAGDKTDFSQIGYAAVWFALQR